MATCDENIAKLNGVPCSQAHCDESQIKDYTHAFCTCQPPFQNGCVNPFPNCCGYDASTPVFVGGYNCYCCCSCFANDTPVAFDATQTKPIDTFQIGDPVYVAADDTLNTWIEKPVLFSSGTGALGGGNTLIRITYGADADIGQLYVNRDQLFLMPDRRLKRASTLVPGKDSLLRQDGSTVPVIDLTVGKYMKGVHHIATSTQVATNVDGHLILANGIVSGDYALQISNLIPDELMVEGHDQLPEFGTKEYVEAYPKLAAGSVRACATDKSKIPDSDVFQPFGKKPPMRIPDYAETFVTEAQARDIQKNAPHAPIHSGVGIDIANYLFKLFKGFYPQVVFYLDVENELPNAYSWVEFGTTFVVVTGGLVRTDAIKFESLGLVIAHELGHLYGGEPKDNNGYTCTGMADYAATISIMPYVWFGVYSTPIVKPSIDQIANFFSYIDPDHRGGEPGNKCNFISIDCRLQAMEAGANTRVLPECAGGPPDPTLEVVGAEAFEDSDGRYVEITFSSPVNQQSAEMVANYAFDPLAPAFSATVDDTNPAKVAVRADIQTDTPYTVTVSGVVSEDGHPLVPDKRSAAFELVTP